MDLGDLPQAASATATQDKVDLIETVANRAVCTLPWTPKHLFLFESEVPYDLQPAVPFKDAVMQEKNKAEKKSICCLVLHCCQLVYFSHLKKEVVSYKSLHYH